MGQRFARCDGVTYSPENVVLSRQSHRPEILAFLRRPESRAAAGCAALLD